MGDLTDNTDVFASAVNGSDGLVTASAAEIFGFRIMDQRTAQSDITTEPVMEPSNLTVEEQEQIDLIENPNEILDVTTLIGRQCPGPGRQITVEELGEFYLIGRGGIPELPDPEYPRNVDTIIADWVTLNGEFRDPQPEASTQSTLPRELEGEPLVEATHWIVNDRGQIELVVMATGVERSPIFIPLSCNNQ